MEQRGREECRRRQRGEECRGLRLKERGADALAATRARSLRRGLWAGRGRSGRAGAEKGRKKCAPACCAELCADMAPQPPKRTCGIFVMAEPLGRQEELVLGPVEARALLVEAQLLPGEAPLARQHQPVARGRRRAARPRIHSAARRRRGAAGARGRLPLRRGRAQHIAACWRPETSNAAAPGWRAPARAEAAPRTGDARCCTRADSRGGAAAAAGPHAARAGGRRAVTGGKKRPDAVGVGSCSAVYRDL